MNPAYRRQLERNIGKYSWYKIFTKRVFLPLIAIQLVNVGKVTIGQIALIAVISGVVQFLLQMPSGYFADRWGNKPSIVLGCLIAAPSPLFYLIMPNFWGGLAAAVLFFGGYAFQSGAIEAFMHDTLMALDKEKEYSRVMGRAQSYGLIGNVVLLLAVPATYAINHALPFLIGFVSLVIMLWLCLSFTYPKSDREVQKKNPFDATRKLVTKQNVALFVFAGLMAGVSYRSADYRELAFQSVGIAVALFGVLVAGGSVIGAVMGRYVHLLDTLKASSFYLFDLLFITAFLVLAGVSHSPVLVAASFIMLAAYDRVRIIIFQAKLLHELQHAYKASLISALNLFSIIGQIAAVTVLSKFIGLKGYQMGYLLFGFSVLAFGLLLWLVVRATVPRPQTA